MFPNHKQNAAIVALLFSASIAYAQVEIQRQSTLTSPADVWIKPKTSGKRGDKVIYAVRVPVKGGPQRQPFDLVLRRLQVANQKADAVFRVKPPLAEIVFDPKFSTQGDAVLFKVGWPFELYSPYRFFLYKFDSGKLLPGPQGNIVYRRIEMSPDGRYVAYVLGGDYSGRPSNFDENLSLYIYDFQKRTNAVIAKGVGLTNFTWRNSTTLLFQYYPQKAVNESIEATTANKQQPPRLSVHLLWNLV